MSIELYKCSQCGKVVTSDIINPNKENYNLFTLLENVVCSKRCYDARQKFYESLIL